VVSKSFFVRVASGRDLVLSWRRCNMSRASGFVDDVMFYNRSTDVVSLVNRA